MIEAFRLPSVPMSCLAFFRNMIWTSFAELIRSWKTAMNSFLRDSWLLFSAHQTTAANLIMLAQWWALMRAFSVPFRWVGYMLHLKTNDWLWSPFQILKPAEKKQKYVYGGMGSGRPITPPRKKKWRNHTSFPFCSRFGRRWDLSSLLSITETVQDPTVPNSMESQRTYATVSDLQNRRERLDRSTFDVPMVDFFSLLE